MEGYFDLNANACRKISIVRNRGTGQDRTEHDPTRNNKLISAIHRKFTGQDRTGQKMRIIEKRIQNEKFFGRQNEIFLRKKLISQFDPRSFPHGSWTFRTSKNMVLDEFYLPETSKI